MAKKMTCVFREMGDGWGTNGSGYAPVGDSPGPGAGQLVENPNRYDGRSGVVVGPEKEEKAPYTGFIPG